MEDKYSRALLKLNKEYLMLFYSSDYQKIIRQKNKKYQLKKFLLYLRNGSLRLIISAIKNRILSTRKLEDTTYRQVSFSNYKKKNIKVAVYTCIVGDYDIIREPLYQNSNIDYFIVTDQTVKKDSVWKKIDINAIEDIKTMTNAKKNRYIKLNPHKIFPDYEYSIYLDGNILIVADMLPIIHEMGNHTIGIHKHSGRTCAYMESKAIIFQGKAKKKDIESQVKSYKNKGFPKNYGLFENNILVRKHNDIVCIRIMESWWEEFCKYPQRDQLSFVYSLWKNNFSSEYIYSLGNAMKLNPRFRYYNH